MCKQSVRSVAAMLALATSAAAYPPDESSMDAVPWTAVNIRGGFMGDRLAVIRTATLESNLAQCEKTGRLRNFDRAAAAMRPASTRAADSYEGYLFNDSDVYKALEGMAYVLGTEQDAARRQALDQRLDSLIARVAAAQHSDGYINTYYTVKAGIDKRWTREQHDHETYCIGHLIEAGVAHFQATGKRSLLEVALRAARHVTAVFGPDKLCDPPGHQEIELALMKLNQVCDEEWFIPLARFFVEQRGRPRMDKEGKARPLFGDYCQDHLPLIQQTQAAGHAVRAAYFYAAATDLARHGGSDGYRYILSQLWDDVTLRRLYLTGGIGPSAHNEGFTDPYDLPNESAYQETCATIGLCMWAHRMHLLTGDSRYMDAFERGLYNAVLAGASLDGKRYFYVNPLASGGKHHRQEWYACACCPPNILRFMASIGGYMYSCRDDDIYVNLYADSTAAIDTVSGRATVTQSTRYPWDGRVRLMVEAPSGRTFCVRLRVPSWCSDVDVLVDGKPVEAAKRDAGYIRVAVKGGTAIINVRFAMPVRRVYADPRVAADRGRVAFERGPLVYAFEAPGEPGTFFDMLSIPGDAAVKEVEGAMEANAVSYPGLSVECRNWRGEPGYSNALYVSPQASRPRIITAIPYFTWDNRGAGAMAVWMLETPQMLPPSPAAGIAPSASHCYAGDSVAALCDNREPARSSDNAIPRFTWWDHKGKEEWVQYDFAAARDVSACDVYWYDDEKTGGGCRTPESWQVEYLKDTVWEPVETTEMAAVRRDQFNRVSFDRVHTRGLRLRVKLRAGMSAGILEWRVR